MASNIEKRIHELVEKLRTASEGAGVKWQEGPGKSYMLKVGSFSIAITKDADPQLTILDDQGEEIEALERQELAAHTASDGRNYSELTDRVWRLARRNAGTAEAAFAKIISMLDEKSGGEAPQAQPEAEPVAAPEPVVEAEAAPEPVEAVEEVAEEAVVEEAPAQEEAVQRPASNGSATVSANDDDDDGDDTPARRPFWS